MSSANRSELGSVDFGRDVPTTPEDIRVLRRLARETRSWLELTADELDRLLPDDRRPPMRPDARPFEFP